MTQEATTSPERTSHHALPQTPVSPVEETWTSSHSSPKRKPNLSRPQPEFRIQEAPASPVSISPPRQNIPDPETASINIISTDNESRRSSRNIPTPDSARVGSPLSMTPLTLRSRPGSSQASHHARNSSSLGNIPRLAEDVEDASAGQEENVEPVAGLSYHAFDDAPKKPPQEPQRHIPSPSVGSNSSAGEQRPHSHRISHGQLAVPRTTASRPNSTYTLGVDLRGRTLSPHNDSDMGSPRIRARDLSSSRKSPGSRPVSYIDLLNNIPYNQQVAPGPSGNNASLQASVGRGASLLDTKKTLEMYRLNVRKTNDPSVQYEFAIFMLNTSNSLSPSDDLDPAELVTEAKHILQRLSDRAYPFAQYYLADGYFSGLFNKSKPDHDKAFPLFVAASKHGHAEAGYRAALCYEFGWGTTKSFPKAVQFYRAAAAKNHPGAATRLGMACLRGDMGLGKDRAIYRDGVKWLKRASESADAQFNAGPYELGLMHLTGDGQDIFKDEAYAAQLLTQSAELGHVDANFLLGRAYENGWHGLPRDAALSVHFYNGAATQGHADAQMALCAWYLVGAPPVLEKDENEAFAWALQAANTGYAKAEYAVAYFTEMGIGCRRDPLEANVWYVRAADQGNENARQRLQIIRAAANGLVDPVIPMGKAEAKAQELGGAGAGAGGKRKFMGIF